MSNENQRQPETNLTVSSSPQIASPYRTAHEAVEYLRLGSLNALYRLIREHRLPYGRRGRTYIFDVRKIDRWVDASGSGAVGSLRKVG